MTTTIKELTSEEIQFFEDEKKCPICRQGEFLGGPCGGLSQNILCKLCCHEFTYSPMGLEPMKYDLKRALEVYGTKPSIEAIRKKAAKPKRPIRPKLRVTSLWDNLCAPWKKFWAKLCGNPPTENSNYDK